ncbi:MAG TPA: tetratricopeptide repeat protein [Chitinophagaceae bacterium]|nr:tetratricopeptide repeat protein [Chitinophagaceae bacterium]
MKKISITFLVTALLAFGGVAVGQSLQEGINDLYAERFKSAQSTFEKLVAANPNNIDAVYWLGQTFIEADNVPAAKDVYDKALLASANAPLVIVGRGQVDLIENKISEARQRFEAAITMTRGKKGDDPVILNAVGRAITDTYTDKEKKGDINYAIEKLEAAALRDPKNAEIFLNLGNAYRKARPGEGGGKAFENYKKANEVNPNFAAPYYRLAQLFNSQRNWDLYEQYLNDAINKDSRFAPAYYDLYYYKLGKRDFNAAETYAKKYIETTDPDPQNDYLRVQTLWAKKDFDQAIAGAKNLIAQAGAKTKPIVYRLIADSYVQKKDTAAGKQYIDDLFAKAKPEDLNANDFRLKADIYSTVPGMEDSLFAIYVQGVAADTVLDNKIELLKKGVEYFRAKAAADKSKAYLREKEGDLASMLVDLKPKPTINEMFDVGRAYYFGGANLKSYEAFTKFSEKYPDEVYGWEWKFNNARIIDSTKKDSIAVPDAMKLMEFAEKDTAKYKKQYLSAAGFLVEYYANVAKDGAKAMEYVKKMLVLDPNNESLKNIQKQLEKSASQPGGGPRSSNNQPKTGSSGKTDSGKRESTNV